MLAEEAVGEAELAGSRLLVAAAVPGKHLVVAGGLRGVCVIIEASIRLSVSPSLVSLYVHIVRILS